MEPIGRSAAWALKPEAVSVEKAYRLAVFSAIPTFLNRERPEHPGAGRGDSDRSGVRLGREGGFSLIELLVVMAVSTVVLGAMLTLLYTSQQVQAGDAEWAQVMQKGRVGLGRMAHEIRQASEVKKAEKGTIEFLAEGQSQAITYNCTEKNECQRTQSGKSQIIIEHVLNGTKVFNYFKGATSTAITTEMNVVTLKIELSAAGTLKQADYKAYEHKTVVLENAAFMRNRDLEG